MIKNIPFAKFSIKHNQCFGFKIENFYLLIKINLKNNQKKYYFKLKKSLNCDWIITLLIVELDIISNRGVPYYYLIF